MSYRGGEILIQLFQNLGIEYVFCSPGTEWIAVWEGLSERYGRQDYSVKYINCRHEMVAVSAAIGYGKVKSKPAAVLLHANHGPLHCAMAIRSALWAKAPILICGAYATDYDEDRVGIIPASQWLGRLSDLERPDSMVRPYVKWSNRVTSKESFVDSIIRGYRIAQTIPRGPVFIDIPREFLINPMNDVKIPSGIMEIVNSQPLAENINDVAKRLINADNPIIITEHAGDNTKAIDKIIELAELLSIPVYEYSSPLYNNFPKNHPLHLGYDATEGLREADLILNIGAVTPWYPASVFPKENSYLVSLDEDPLNQNLPYYGYRMDCSISGDIEQSLRTIIESIHKHLQDSKRSIAKYRKRFLRHRAKHDKMVKQWETEALAEQSDTPISPKWFHHLINKLLPDNTFGIIETLTQTRYAHRYLTNMQGYFRTSGGGLGIGFGIAIGARIAIKDRPVVYFVGDGSFNYNPIPAGLGLCQEYSIPILTCIFNNRSYAAMKLGYNKDGWAAKNDSYLGVNILPSPEYTKIAEAFDVLALKLDDPGNIEFTWAKAFEELNAGKSALIDVIV